MLYSEEDIFTLQFLLYMTHAHTCRPINDISGGANASPVKRNTVRGFRFPDDTPSSNSQYPAPSPFNYGDKISHRRKGLFRKDASGEIIYMKTVQICSY
jgi:hypothetical protein